MKFIMHRILKIIMFSIFAFSVIGINAMNNDYTAIPKKASNPITHDELNQQELFDTIRKGVVAIKVTAYLILDKYVNEKL